MQGISLQDPLFSFDHMLLNRILTCCGNLLQDLQQGNMMSHAVQLNVRLAVVLVLEVTLPLALLVTLWQGPCPQQLANCGLPLRVPLLERYHLQAQEVLCVYSWLNQMLG